MWGICLDILTDEGNLFQKVVEYQFDSVGHIANILQPTKGVQISINAIKPTNEPPEFVYGDFVSLANHSDIKGKIETISWSFKNMDYIYYISVNGKKKSKRYYAKDLMKQN